MIQKFVYGDIVEYIGSYNTGEQSIILKCNTELSGHKLKRNENYHQHNDIAYYMLDLKDGREHAWILQDHLKFISENNEQLIIECKQKYIDKKNKENNIEWIIENYKVIDYNQILFLFDKIGYVPNAFLNEGSYIHLMFDWMQLKILFDALIVCKTNELVLEIIRQNEKFFENKKEKVLSLFNEIKKMQNL